MTPTAAAARRKASATPEPDGAPPGAAEERTPAERYAYDADGRARAREGAAVTIGEVDFHRVRKTWEVTRHMRRLLREQEMHVGRANRLRARIDAHTDKIRGVREPF